jgi:hypothetical protein
MIQPTGAFSYDFNLTYYENVYMNMLKTAKTTGEVAVIFNSAGTSPNEDKYWYDTSWPSATTTTIDGVVVDNGIDVRAYVQDTYDGEQAKCLVDKFAYAVLDFSKNLPGGCFLAQALYQFIDWFTDLFGTFICTATVKSTQCSAALIPILQQYRDEVVPQIEDGYKMAKYYTVIGPRIVRAIDADPEKEQVYKYIGITYLQPLVMYMGSGDVDKCLFVYFDMLNDMVNRYSIKTTPTFDKWVIRYTDGL